MDNQADKTQQETRSDNTQIPKISLDSLYPLMNINTGMIMSKISSDFEKRFKQHVNGSAKEIRLRDGIYEMLNYYFLKYGLNEIKKLKVESNNTFLDMFNDLRAVKKQLFEIDSAVEDALHTFFRYYEDRIYLGDDIEDINLVEKVFEGSQIINKTLVSVDLNKNQEAIENCINRLYSSVKQYNTVLDVVGKNLSEEIYDSCRKPEGLVQLQALEKNIDVVNIFLENLNEKPYTLDTGRTLLELKQAFSQMSSEILEQYVVVDFYKIDPDNTTELYDLGLKFNCSLLLEKYGFKRKKIIENIAAVGAGDFDVIWKLTAPHELAIPIDKLIRTYGLDDMSDADYVRFVNKYPSLLDCLCTAVSSIVDKIRS